MQLIKSKTYQNLAKSFAGECQAHVKYLFIEYGARKQGYKALAEIINKVSYHEFNHARMLYTFIQQASDETIDNIDICSGYPFKEKWDLIENLKLASQDENFEATKIYPEYSKVAKDEGFEEIGQLFDNLIQVETCHSKLFEDLYNQLNGKTMYKKDEKIKWKCSACGYESESEQAWKMCPLCKEPQGTTMLHLEE